MSQSYLLDTNVISELTKPQPESNVVAWVDSHSDLHLSVITLGELRRGFELLPQGKRRTQLEEWFEVSVLPIVASRILPITPPIAERWGVLGAQCKLRGTPLALADGLIAATALEHGLTVVTRNTKDFNGLGLILFNPWL